MALFQQPLKSIEATPKMPVQTGNSADPPERRLHFRQRLDAIVYLDIGADNGGIVLNLSDEGMGFQAVGPLDTEGELRLRVKLPGTQKRIEVAANIAWLSESKRQAGVRFADIQSEGPIQIQEWVRAQASPGAPPEQSSQPDKKPSEPQEEQGAVLELPKDKPPNSMLPSESLDLSGQKLAEVGSGDTRHGASNSQEEASQTAAVRAAGVEARMVALGDAAIVAQSHDDSKTEMSIDRPIQKSEITAMAVPRPPEARVLPIDLLGPDLEADPYFTPRIVDPIFDVPPPASEMIVWNRVAIAVLFAVCTILCIGIGTWVGQIVTRRYSPIAATPPAVDVPRAEPGISGSNVRNTRNLAKARTGKAHALPAPDHSPLESLNSSASVNPPELVPTRETALSTSPEQNAAPIATAKEQASKPAVTPAIENPQPAAAMSRIVGGLTLKPSDRFNPSFLAYRVEAAYPQEAQKQRIEGVVKVLQVIGADGRVRSVKPLSGPPLLVPAALEAAQYWRYMPALLNGQPVETEQDVEIEFRLPY